MKETLVTDIGYGSTKFAYSNGEKVIYGKFPTAVTLLGFGEAEHVEVEGAGEYSEVQEFFYNGARYVVGKEAFLEGNPLPTRTKDFIPTYAPLIIAKISEQAKRQFSSLVVSVAISDFKDAHYKEKIVKNLKNFVVNGKPYSFNKVIVLPQGYGIYRDVYPKGAPGVHVVADIGFNTVDISVYRDGKPIRGKLIGLAGYGTIRLIKKIAGKIAAEVGYSLSEVEISDILQAGGKFKLRGMDYDFREVIAKSSYVYASEVLHAIEENPELGAYWGRADSRIIGGGGGYYIPKKVQKEHSIIIPEKPEFSNVRGFCNILMEEANG